MKQKLLQEIRDVAAKNRVNLANIDNFTAEELKMVFTIACDNPDGWKIDETKVEEFDKRRVNHFFLTLHPNHPELLLDASRETRRDEEVVKDLLCRNYDYFNYLDEDIKADRDLVLQTLIYKRRKGGGHYGKLTEFDLLKDNQEFRNDKELITEAVSTHYAMFVKPKKHILELEPTEEMFSENPYAIIYSHPCFGDDDKIMRAVISKSPCLIFEASNRLKDDKEFAVYALTCGQSESFIVYSYLSECLQADPDIKALANL